MQRLLGKQQGRIRTEDTEPICLDIHIDSGCVMLRLEDA